MKLLTRAMTVVTFGAALMVGTTISASAGEDFYLGTKQCVEGSHLYDLKAGQVAFHPHGDTWDVHDAARDGARVVVRVYVNGESRETLENRQGVGTSVEFNRNYGEGADVGAAVWLEDDGEAVACTKTQNEYAGEA